MNRKDDDDMDAVLNKHSDDDAGKRKGKAGTHKSLITRNLRLAYGEVASETVPQRLLDILNKIDGEEKSWAISPTLKPI